MKRIGLSLGVLALCAAPRPADATIRYRISVANPDQHFFQVTMKVPSVGRELVVAIPSWNGLYQIRDFASRVQNVRAEAPQEDSAAKPMALSIWKLDKQTWRISAGPGVLCGKRLGDVQIHYAIYWDEPGPFSSQLNGHHAFINLAEVLFYIPDRRAESARVEFSDLLPAWKTAVELKSAGAPNSFAAPGYDQLVDAPAEIGNFEEFRFEANGARTRVVVDGGPWKIEKLSDELRRIVAYETKLMGGAPFEEYTFFFHFGPYSEVGGGGMEHANSAAIAASSDDSAAGVAAHEFFHLWNVKRIRPQSLEPVDYSREQWTRALWFAEGVTSTYGSYTLLRSGLWSRQQFLAALASEISRLDSRPARLWKSVEEASLDAWLEKYDLYGRPDLSISYYNKGEILGVLLDLLIRDSTDNRASLDNVLRGLNDRFARAARFYNDNADIQAVAEQVAGRSFEEFFRSFVAGTKEIPYNDFLKLAGLRAKSFTRAMADFGFSEGRGPGRSVVVIQVSPGSGAEAAGVHEGDLLLELNGEAPPRNPDRWLRQHTPGEKIRIRLRHGAEVRELSFALGTREERSYEIEEASGAGEKQRRIRAGWLRGTEE